MLKKKKWCTKVCSSVCSPHFRTLLLRNLSVPALSIMVAADWELLGKFSTQNMQSWRGHVFGDCVGLMRWAEAYRDLFLPKNEKKKEMGGKSCGLEEPAMGGQGCHRVSAGGRSTISKLRFELASKWRRAWDFVLSREPQWDQMTYSNFRTYFLYEK